MRSRIAVFGLALAALAAAARPAIAQEERFLAGLEVGLFEPMGFSNSYDAVYGDSLVPVGARFEWAVAEPFALALSGTFMSTDGEQVAIVPDVGVVPTGISTSLDVAYFHLTAAWRIHPEGPWSGYLGAGPTWAKFEESNEFESLSRSKVGGHAAAGIRRSFGRFVLGAEALYAIVPDLVGAAGATAVFNEDDGGGFAATLLLGYAF